MNIGRKIYYDLSTGNLIQDTGERSGSVKETTQEEDFVKYSTLVERVPSTVGCIQLDYGEYAEDFNLCISYRVNPTTEALEFTYPEPDTEPPAYRPPLSVQVQQLQETVDQLVLDALGGM